MSMTTPGNLFPAANIPSVTYPGQVSPYSNVTPFTDRDLRTFQGQLEGFIYWLNVEVRKHLDDEMAKLITEVNRVLTELYTSIDNIDAIYKAIQALDAIFNGYLSETKDVRDEVKAIHDAVKVLAAQAAQDAASLHFTWTPATGLYGNGLSDQKIPSVNPTTLMLPEGVQTAHGVLNLETFGVVGLADDTAVFKAALARAKALRIPLTIPAGTYTVDNLGLDGTVAIVGAGTGPYRFGATGVTLVRKAGSNDPLVTVNNGGVAVSNITFDGNGGSASIVRVAAGFETQFKNVRVINGGGVGLSIESDNNAKYDHVLVDNCGSATLPGVRIAGSTYTLNTIDFYSLHIERCKNIALQIGTVDASDKLPTNIRFTDLHIESAVDHDGVDNVGPLVAVEAFYGVMFTNPFLYGGPGPSIRVRQSNTAAVVGGLIVLGGFLLGKAAPLKPSPAIDVITGNGVNVDNTRFVYADTGIVIESTAGDSVTVGPGNTYDGSVTVTVSDLRAAGRRKNVPLWGDSQFNGHVVSGAAATTLGNGGENGASGPAPASAGQAPNDTSGKVFFGTGAAPAAGRQVVGTFGRAYAREPRIIVTPGNPATAALGLYAASTVNGFTVFTQNAPAANVAVATYQFSYLIVE